MAHCPQIVFTASAAADGGKPSFTSSYFTAVQQLRLTAIELQLAPVRSSVYIPVATLWAHFQAGDVDAGLTELEAAAKTMIDDLLWWSEALKAAREKTLRQAA